MDLPGTRPGALVRSTAGRDRGTVYVVLRQVDERRVAVCDGRRRTAARCKVKNRRHLAVLGSVDADLALRLQRGERVPDLDITKALAASQIPTIEEV